MRERGGHIGESYENDYYGAKGSCEEDEEQKYLWKYRDVQERCSRLFNQIA